jgi:hypothetical protein
VTFASADGARVDVSRNTGGAAAVASSGATIVARYFEGLCTSPCTARLPRGRHHFAFKDLEARAIGGKSFLIDQPTTITLRHKSRAGVRNGLLIGGLSAIVLGATATYFTFREIGRLDSVPSRLSIWGGVAGLTLGPAAIWLSLRAHDTFTTTQTP